MTKKNLLSVTLNGTPHFRKTENNYTHVLIGLRSVEWAFQYAYSWTPDDERALNQEFDFYKSQADGTWWTRNLIHFHKNDDRVQAKAVKIVAAGLDTLREQTKADRISQFLKEIEVGKFKWTVLSWHTNLRNAEAKQKTLMNYGWYKDVRVIEVGDVITI